MHQTECHIKRYHLIFSQYRKCRQYLHIFKINRVNLEIISVMKLRLMHMVFISRSHSHLMPFYPSVTIFQLLHLNWTLFLPYTHLIIFGHQESSFILFAIASFENSIFILSVYSPMQILTLFIKQCVFLTFCF